MDSNRLVYCWPSKGGIIFVWLICCYRTAGLVESVYTRSMILYVSEYTGRNSVYVVLFQLKRRQVYHHQTCKQIKPELRQMCIWWALRKCEVFIGHVTVFCIRVPRERCVRKSCLSNWWRRTVGQRLRRLAGRKTALYRLQEWYRRERKSLAESWLWTCTE